MHVHERFIELTAESGAVTVTLRPARSVVSRAAAIPIPLLVVGFALVWAGMQVSLSEFTDEATKTLLNAVTVFIVLLAGAIVLSIAVLAYRTGRGAVWTVRAERNALEVRSKKGGVGRHSAEYRPVAAADLVVRGTDPWCYVALVGWNLEVAQEAGFEIELLPAARMSESDAQHFANVLREAISR